MGINGCCDTLGQKRELIEKCLNEKLAFAAQKN